MLAHPGSGLFNKLTFMHIILIIVCIIVNIKLNNMKLYRIKPDDSGREKLSDEACQHINVNGNWVYYVSI